MMDSRFPTHLSIEDLNLYLIGSPSTAQRKAIEEHYLGCSECLDQICALAARIDKSQLGHHFVPVPVSPVPGFPAPQSNVFSMQWPTLSPGQGLALKAVGAALLLVLLPDTTRLVRIDQIVDSPMTVAAMNLPFTRELTPSLALMSVPNVELPAAPAPRPHQLVRPRTYREFRAPQGRPVQFVEVAYYEAPQLYFTDGSIDPMPVDLDVIPAAVYRPKPNLFKRLLSAVASSFRSPRT
jgi:hypothetical protein